MSEHLKPYLKDDAPVDIKGHIINNYGLFWRNKV